MVECVAWAPASAAAAIDEAAGGDNSRSAHQGPFLASGSRDKTIKVATRPPPSLPAGCGIASPASFTWKLRTRLLQQTIGTGVGGAHWPSYICGHSSGVLQYGIRIIHCQWLTRYIAQLVLFLNKYDAAIMAQLTERR